ncbi:helix-turn-helix domain-containing protein [Nocardioides hankookensis]|uniref:ArsR/SmtB family transcription factor n=1 Tax=Nocardioides hankookensis TaxID=443157 RepID=A0ABW1LDY1_9ACTN
MAPRDDGAEEQAAVGSLQEVLAAVSDPVRLEMVRRMHAEGGPAPCAQLYDGVGKSTASHHFKILREAGVTNRSVIGGQTHQELRLDDVEAAYPGVLSSILASSPAR